ncbi:alpha/beta fold hydrolase, partial [Rubrivirga sp.]|uniref:alpha/beta fold hydrolase n=1 Tax=Rubrivirga sp. TaxID=1885344 RepID=UPI003C7197D6
FVALRGRGPVPVLVIHGGPGSSLLPFARTIARRTDLELDHTLAYWEQRGTGRSRGALREDDLSLAAILEDAIEVAARLTDRFKRPPVVVGHSWGTVIGVMLAQRRPDLVASYVGVGQVVNVREQERLSTAWAREQAEAAGDRASLRALDRIGAPPHTAVDMLRQRSVLARFGGVWHGHGQRSLVASGLKDYLTTSEYGPADLWRQARDPAFSLRALMPDKLEVDLEVQAPRLDVPVQFVAGVHDRITPLALVERYATALDAPGGARVILFEASAHLPFLSEPGRFGAVVRDATSRPR